MPGTLLGSWDPAVNQMRSLLPKTSYSSVEAIKTTKKAINVKESRTHNLQQKTQICDDKLSWGVWGTRTGQGILRLGGESPSSWSKWCEAENWRLRRSWHSRCSWGSEVEGRKACSRPGPWKSRSEIWNLRAMGSHREVVSRKVTRSNFVSRDPFVIVGGGDNILDRKNVRISQGRDMGHGRLWSVAVRAMMSATTISFNPQSIPTRKVHY